MLHELTRGDDRAQWVELSGPRARAELEVSHSLLVCWGASMGAEVGRTKKWARLGSYPQPGPGGIHGTPLAFAESRSRVTHRCPGRQADLAKHQVLRSDSCVLA